VRASAVILAGGFSKRFGHDKGLVELAGKPLILHVLERASRVVDETVVVVSSDIQEASFSRLLKERSSIIIDKYEDHCPLVGALTGFESIRGEYSLLFPCDTPFISTEIASLLLDICVNKSAVIPRWPNGYIEPLHSAYNTESALKAAETALEQGKRDLTSMISYLRGVRYISTLALQKMDRQLLTFFNVNTSLDMKKAELIFKQRRESVNC